MSLKVFHLVFITLSIVIAVWFGVWALQAHAAGGPGWYLPAGIVSFVCAIGLVVYEWQVIKKFRELRIK